MKSITLSWKSVTATAELKKPSKGFQFWRSSKEWGNGDTHRTLLTNISGSAKPGTLTYIMGGSGAGKTTLMTCLYGVAKSRTLSMVGDVTAVDSSGTHYPRTDVTSLVEQEPNILNCFTVREHLWFQMTLRSKVSDPELETDVLLEKVGLSDKKGDVIGQIGAGLSGGERKRLIIATELILAPSILLVDEATTGLDSKNSLKMIALLKGLAEEGRTVVTTIHQPSTALFMMGDNLSLLSGGHLLYQGEICKVPNMMTSLGYPCPLQVNIADHLIELTNDNMSYFSLQLQKESRAQYMHMAGPVYGKDNTKRGTIEIEEKNKKSVTASCTQFKALLWRCSIMTMRYQSLGRKRWIQALLIFASMVFVFFPLSASPLNRIGLICFCLLRNSTVMGLWFGKALIENKKLYVEEAHRKMYPVWLLYLCILLVEIPMTASCSVLFSTGVYWTMRFSPSLVHFLQAVLAFVMCDLAGLAFCSIIGNIADTVVVQQLIFTTIIPVLSIFMGNMINKTTLPPVLRLVEYLVWFNPAAEIVLVNEIMNRPEDSRSRSVFKGGVVVSYYGFKEDVDVWQNYGRILGLVVLYLGVGFVIMLRKTRAKVRSTKTL